MVKKKKRKNDEEILQQHCISYLSFLANRVNIIFYAPMNEAILMILKKYRVPDKICFAILAFLKKMGWLPGVSDLVIGFGGKMFCVELKTKIGVQSDNQKLFMKNCHKADVVYVVVRSFEEFQGYLTYWGMG